MRARAALRGGLAALTIAALWLLGAGIPTGFPLDDSWIHQVVARHAAGGPGFATGTTPGASTSLLWTWLLAPAHATAVMDPVLYTRLLSGSLWIVAVEAIFELSRADGWTDLESLVIATGAAVSGQAAWFVWSGMEATLVIATSVLSVVAWRRGWTIARDASLIALALTRPEGVVLGIVLAGFERRWPARARLIAVPALAFLLSLAWSWNATGTAMPTTFAGRRWLYGLDRGIRPLDLAYFIAQWLHSVWYYTLQRSTVLGAILAAGIGLGLLGLRKRSAAAWTALLAWITVHFLIYFVLLPRTGHGGRYQPLIPVVLLPLVAMGGLLASRALGSARSAALTFCVVAAVGVPSLITWRDILRGGIAHIEGTHRSLGRWARMNLAPEARVAAFDIGAIAWELPGQVVDLSALSSGNLVYLRQGRVADLLREERAGYVMLPSPPPGTMEGTTRFNLGPDRIALHELQRRQTPVDLWRRSFDATAHAWSGQVLYEIEAHRDAAAAP